MKKSMHWLCSVISKKHLIRVTIPFYWRNYLKLAYVILWFTNYLTNRQQFVHVNGHSSSLIQILLGVPQGSILGPILFLLYINDLPLSSNLISLLFADDTTLLACSDTIEDLLNFVNLEFRKVVEFFRSNKIALHPNKTKYVIFSNSPYVINFDSQIFCNFNNSNETNPTLISQVVRVKSTDEIPAVRFLGAFFDPNLNFKFHISTIRTKLSKALFALRTSRNYLTKKALISIYYALFHSHLVYAIETWSCTNSSFLLGLFKMQKSAVRIIENVRYNTHTEPIFKKLEILPLPELATYFKLQFMQKFHQKTLPTLLSNSWIYNSDRIIGENALVLRNHYQVNIPYIRLSSIERHPLISFLKLWDDLPDNNIKIIRNRPEFSKKLKEYLIKNLSSTVNCMRVLCPSCNLNPFNAP